MMWNTGEAFRRPYESAYSKCRRFIVANPILSVPEAAKQARAYAIEEGADSPRIRCQVNCPECARQFFHTELYELPWLTTCPIHRIDLVTKCPACQRAWPDVYDLKKHTCLICGAGFSFHELAIRKAFAPIGCFERIEPLVQTITIYQQFRNVFLDSGRDFDANASHYISSAGIRSRYIPSFAACINKTLLSYFETLGIHVEEIMHATWKNPCELVDSKRISYAHLLQAQYAAKPVVFATQKRIVRAIREHFIAHRIRGTEETVDMTRIDACSDHFAIALEIWKTVLRFRPRRQNTLAYVPFRALYDATRLKSPPLIPTLKPVMTSLNYHLPPFLIHMLFQAELIALYFNVLKYLDKLKSVCLDELIDVLQFFEDESVLPENSSDFPFAVQLDGQNLSLLIPERFLTCDLERLGLSDLREPQEALYLLKKRVDGSLPYIGNLL